MRLTEAVRTVALFEAAKGLLVVFAGIGALALLHNDVQQLAERLVGHFHLNPAKGYPRIFLDYTAQLTDTRLGTLAAFAAAYASTRFIEAYGLWRRRRWAEWFAAISGAVYIPFEVYEIFRGSGWLAVGTLLLNVAVVALMLIVLFRRLAPSAPGTTPAGSDR